MLGERGNKYVNINTVTFSIKIKYKNGLID